MTWTQEEGRRKFDAHVAQLAGAGFDIRHLQFLTEHELLEMDRRALDLLHGEMARVHATWFDNYEVPYPIPNHARYSPRPVGD